MTLLLEKLVEILRNKSSDSTKPYYEAVLGSPVAVKSYANTGIQCAEQFITVIAIILHEYDLKKDVSTEKHEAYREALADFAGFFEGCVKELAQAQPQEPEVKA